jgi:probable rRNA maturation factor
MISLTFVGRDRMRALHARYKGWARAADVLAFVLPGPDGRLAGDIYICPWTAGRQARRHRVPVREELVRLVVHGTLHVLGWDHPEDGRRMESPMWRRQERYVEALR